MNEETQLGNFEEIARLTGLAIATAQLTLEIRLDLIDHDRSEEESYLLGKISTLGMFFDYIFTSQSNYIKAKNNYREIKREINNL